MPGAIVIGVRSWLVWLSLTIVVVMGLGSYLALRKPAPAEACRDTIERVSQFEGCGTHCPYAGQAIEWVQQPVRGYYATSGTFRCICPGAK